uniref:DUF4440 domain-containing protein n=1 Tax=Panagrellus redivivus TaxID=6233 RepID=A0A7E4UQZ5_PANRE
MALAVGIGRREHCSAICVGLDLSNSAVLRDRRVCLVERKRITTCEAASSSLTFIVIMALFQDIKSRQEEFMRAFNEGNAGKAAEIYHPDGYFMPNHSPPLKGRAEIEQYFKSDMADGVATAQIITEEVNGCGCDVFAYERGSYHLNGTKGTESGTYLQVWKKEAGQWLILSDCFNVTKAAQA